MILKVPGNFWNKLKVVGMAWRRLGNFAKVVSYLLPDGYMKKFSTEIFEILSKLYDSMIALHSAKQISN